MITCFEVRSMINCSEKGGEFMFAEDKAQSIKELKQIASSKR
jgi:hypothetical protein